MFRGVGFEERQDSGHRVVGAVQLAPCRVKAGAAVHLGFVPEGPHGVGPPGRIRPLLQLVDHILLLLQLACALRDRGDGIVGIGKYDVKGRGRALTVASRWLAKIWACGAKSAVCRGELRSARVYVLLA